MLAFKADLVAESKTTVRMVKRGADSRCVRWRLLVTDGKSAGTSFALAPGEIVIGRDAEADIQLQDSGVSRKHARLVFSEDARLLVCDLESTNGTFVNDVRVQLSALESGWRLRIGPDAELRFEPAVLDAAPVGLRPRELDVARLVAKGLTNPEIAAHLGIAPRTVATHLENAYRRLGIGSRAELTRHVSSLGLL